MFSKFKKFLNVFDSKFSAFFGRFLYPTRGVFKEIFRCFLAGVVVIAVFIPCFVELGLAFGFQESPKLFNGVTMFFERGQENFVGVFGGQERSVFESSQFRIKGGREGIAGGIKSFFEFMLSSDDACEQGSKQNGECPNDDFLDHLLTVSTIVAVLFILYFCHITIRSASRGFLRIRCTA